MTSKPPPPRKPPKPPALTLKGLAVPRPGLMVATLKGPVWLAATEAGKGGRRRKPVTGAEVKAEKKRRIDASDDASNKAIARHFKVSPPTIGRRLKE